MSIKYRMVYNVAIGYGAEILKTGAASREKHNCIARECLYAVSSIFLQENSEHST